MGAPRDVGRSHAPGPSRPSPSERARERNVTMLRAIVISMRPRQWVKNLFVFGGLVFAQRLFTQATWTDLAAFAIFCGL